MLNERKWLIKGLTCGRGKVWLCFSFRDVLPRVLLFCPSQTSPGCPEPRCCQPGLHCFRYPTGPWNSHLLCSPPNPTTRSMWFWEQRRSTTLSSPSRDLPCQQALIKVAVLSELTDMVHLGTKMCTCVSSPEQYGLLDTLSCIGKSMFKPKYTHYDS